MARWRLLVELRTGKGRDNAHSLQEQVFCAKVVSAHKRGVCSGSGSGSVVPCLSGRRFSAVPQVSELHENTLQSNLSPGECHARCAHAVQSFVCRAPSWRWHQSQQFYDFVAFLVIQRWHGGFRCNVLAVRTQCKSMARRCGS